MCSRATALAASHFAEAGVWMFEKVDGVWKKSERVCGGWIC